MGFMSEIVVKQVDGLTMVGRGESRHWVPMDGPEKFKGSEAGTRPMELFLISLAGCTGMDVISLLDKMRVKYRTMEVTVDSERAPEHPKVYTYIKLVYKIYGKNLDQYRDKIKKAIDLSQNKYCSVSEMIRRANITLEHEYQLIEDEA